jgi:hypothetical protein
VIKRSTRIEDLICDPEVPIVVTPRAPLLHLTFENDPKLKRQIPVTPDTTVDHIIGLVRGIDPQIASVVLRVGDREVKKGTKLIKVNPELEEPIIVAKVVHFGEKLLFVDVVPKFALPRPWNVKYARPIPVDLSKVKKIRDLAAYLTTHLGLGPIAGYNVSQGGRSVDLDKQLSKLDVDSRLTISYTAPTDLIRYDIVLTARPGDVENRQSRRCRPFSRRR